MPKAKPGSKKDVSVQEAIQIPELRRTEMEIILVGDSPLIVHAWSQKAKMEMLGKHLGLLSVREAKDPYQDFLRSMYRMEDNSYGFPVVGIKEAMATATTDFEGATKAGIYRNVMVTGRRGFQLAAFADLKTPQELAELFSPNAPQIREDMVRLSGMQRTPDIRYRAEFWPWAIRFKLGYMRRFISPESIMNLLQYAGFSVGLAEWRQEKGGSNGAFHVAAQEEVATVGRWIKAGQKEPKAIDVKAWVSTLKRHHDEKPGAESAPDSGKPPPTRRRTAGNGKAELQ